MNQRLLALSIVIALAAGIPVARAKYHLPADAGAIEQLWQGLAAKSIQVRSTICLLGSNGKVENSDAIVDQFRLLPFLDTTTEVQQANSPFHGLTDLPERGIQNAGISNLLESKTRERQGFLQVQGKDLIKLWRLYERKLLTPAADKTQLSTDEISTFRTGLVEKSGEHAVQSAEAFVSRYTPQERAEILKNTWFVYAPSK
jgi:hypothetical protein